MNLKLFIFITGLAASCDTLLLAEMSVSRFHPIIINNGQIHNGTLTSNSDEQNITHSYNASNAAISGSNSSTSTPTSHNNSVSKNFSTTTSFTQSSKNKQKHKRGATTTQSSEGTKHSTHVDENYNINSTTNNEIIYKFYVPQNIGVATARITIAQVCLQCPDVGFYIQANALPRTAATGTDECNYIHSTIIKPNQTGEISIEFYVQPNTWHYAQLKFVNANANANGLGEPSVSSSSSQSLSLSSSLKSTEVRHRNRRNNHENSLDTNVMVWYNLEYSIEIDFHQPYDEEDNNEDDNSNEESTLHMTPTTATVLGNVTAAETNNTNDDPNNSTKSKSNAWRPTRFRDMEFYPLLRQTYREFFMFDYDLIPDANGTVPLVLNLTAGTPAGFAFEVGDVYDIGGTLSFAVSMKHGLKGTNELKSMPAVASATERSGILAEKLIGRPLGKIDEDNDDNDDEEKALPRSNQTIIVCMHLGEPGSPTWPDKCRYGRKILPASSIVNNTDSNTSTGLIHVPFPESGQWYVTMGLYCHGAETAARVTIIDSVKEFVKKYAKMLETMRTPCACASAAARFQACVNDRKCLVAMNETETLKIKECLMDSKCTPNYVEMTKKFETHHKFATEQHFALDNCNTSVVFTISSSPCVAGRCGRFGRCYHYMSGGFVFSTCVCMKGHRGWDCTEDSQVPSSMSILLASLLLTLSNLLFFPSIYMAVRRRYYTEAVIYFFAMFFSIFYHACDSGEDEYSFCLVKIGVLQFCDFYCGLLAIWVTLVAMSHIRPQFVSLLHMFGAILLAFGTELNKQSLWVFLAPALTGICIISVSWGLRCHKSRKWFPAKKYLTVYMPLGAVLVMVGLVCYAFLQTKQNYHIVHSVWHMVMALSILCLLPSRKSFIPKC